MICFFSPTLLMKLYDKLFNSRDMYDQNFFCMEAKPGIKKLHLWSFLHLAPYRGLNTGLS